MTCSVYTERVIPYTCMVGGVCCAAPFSLLSSAPSRCATAVMAWAFPPPPSRRLPGGRVGDGVARRPPPALWDRGAQSDQPAAARVAPARRCNLSPAYRLV